ncbi:NUDIX domain-containing protein [Roseiterribacter gracilis]|uniref:ADP-ribose pyrophosphatase n=1 Tax=Roseiterribacter gracilis TaxID=2812848 RepID=A0A8S8XAM9_9PROT|nr:ADP-ribose diphosphatase [Rhodospirillales bacterium TMPK1]
MAANDPKSIGTDVEILARDVAFQGYFRVDRWRLRFRTFAGPMSAPVEREVFERGHAVAVLPYDPVADSVVLIEQFRVGALAAGRKQPWLIEIVAGICGDDEAREEVARRETKEETGCDLGRIEPICEYLVSPGGTSESCAVFVGEIDCRHAGGVHGLANEHEDIRTLTLPADEAIARLDDGTIDNAVTIIALQWLARARPRLRQRWLQSSRSE